MRPVILNEDWVRDGAGKLIRVRYRSTDPSSNPSAFDWLWLPVFVLALIFVWVACERCPYVTYKG